MATTLRSSGIELGTSVMDVSGSAPSFPAPAWVNFNGSGTVAVRTSSNVSSITHGGIGIYNINFTPALPDANYAYGMCGQYGIDLNDNTTGAQFFNGTRTTAQTSSAFKGQWKQGNFNQPFDSATICVAFFR